MKIFKSWTMKTEITTDECDFSVFDEIGRMDLDKSEEAGEIKKIESLLADEKKQAMAGSIAGKSIRFYHRKKKKILQDLENIKQIGSLQKLAEDETVLMGMPQKVVHHEIKLRFDSKEFYQRRNIVYIKIKKLKKAKSILELRLKDTEDAISGHGEIERINKLKTVPVVWKIETTKLIEVKVKDKQYKIIDMNEISLGIGQTAVGNDQLRAEWANKADYWFHLDGDKSAHIIVKLRECNLESNILQMIGSALVEFSKLNYRQANLVYTQVKNLKGVKGAAGKVIVKKEKRIQVDCISHWRDIFNSE